MDVSTKEPTVTDVRTATYRELNERLEALRAEYATVINRGGYAPRLAVEIDNIKRELRHRDRWGTDPFFDI